ncbi:MAG: hypothetical protein QNJ01_01505 [Desulfobacterales bacterium]|nr:hypothetical protein [Desulfobacterales bacterium]
MPNRTLMALAAGFCLLLALGAGCTRNLKEERYTRADARYNMLIAGDASEFKDRLRQRLIEHYRIGCNIDVVNIATLGRIDDERYSVVVIMDTCLAWSHFNPSIKSFLDRVADRGKVVILMTADDKDWAFSYQGVDAMTAASKPENEDLVFERLRNEIDRVTGRVPVSVRVPPNDSRVSSA